MFSDSPIQSRHWPNAGVAGAILFAVAWLWSLATSFSLMREACQVNLESLENFSPPDK